MSCTSRSYGGFAARLIDILFIHHSTFGVAIPGKISASCFTRQISRRKDGLPVLDRRDVVDADGRTG